MGSPPPPPPPLLFFKQSPISHSRDETSRTKLRKKHKYEKLELVLNETQKYKFPQRDRHKDRKHALQRGDETNKTKTVISFFPFAPESHSQEKKEN